MLFGGVRHVGVLTSAPGDGFGSRSIHRQAHAALMIEYHHVAVLEAEGTDLGTAYIAVHRFLADALNMTGGACGPTLRTEFGNEGVARVPPLDEVHHTRRAGVRGDADFQQLDRNGVAYLGAGHRYRLGHLMTTMKLRGDHRPPTARRGPGADDAAVFQRPQHGHIRPDDATGVTVHGDYG